MKGPHLVGPHSHIERDIEGLHATELGGHSLAASPPASSPPLPWNVIGRRRAHGLCSGRRLHGLGVALSSQPASRL